MAVGTRFEDPETQAAIAAQIDPNAQATTAQAKPEEAAVEKPLESQDTDQQATKEVETPNPDTDDGAGKPSESAAADSDNLDMTKDKQDLPQSQEEIDKVLTESGFSNEALGKELATNDGKLTDETVKALKEKFPADAVDKTLEDLYQQYQEQLPAAKEKALAQKAKVESMNDFIYGELAGGDIAKGKENLAVLSKWAQDNMDKAQLEAINAKLASGNKTVAREGLETAVNLWKKGQEKPMMTGDSTATNNQTPAEKVEPLSRDAYIKLQMTEKYQSDTEYADKIDARRRASMSGEGFMTPEYNAKYRPAVR